MCFRFVKRHASVCLFLFKAMPGLHKVFENADVPGFLFTT
jgi:hypothetical protein